MKISLTSYKMVGLIFATCAPDRADSEVASAPKPLALIPWSDKLRRSFILAINIMDEKIALRWSRPDPCCPSPGLSAASGLARLSGASRSHASGAATHSLAQLNDCCCVTVWISPLAVVAQVEQNYFLIDAQLALIVCLFWRFTSLWTFCKSVDIDIGIWYWYWYWYLSLVLDGGLNH